MDAEEGEDVCEGAVIDVGEQRNVSAEGEIENFASVDGEGVLTVRTSPPWRSRILTWAALKTVAPRDEALANAMCPY